MISLEDEYQMRMNPPLHIVYDRELIPEPVLVPSRPRWQLDTLLAMTVVRPMPVALVTGI